ncbi:hypothetical protein HBH75_101720 [Parastagonospora nodorum]|nr:hypothetical protein HBH75_101720 [Parastagonospora nodorum]
MNLALLLNLQGARKRGNADCVNNNNNNERTALLAKRIKTNEDCKKSTHSGNNCNNLNIMVTNPTGREFSRVDMKSLTRLCLLIDRAKLLQPVFKLQRYDYYNLQDTDVANVFNIVVSKLDEVPTREPSTLYFMWDKEQDYSAEEHDYRKFYCLVITSEDTHCKQIIKKAYIMSLERALLILFMT